MSETAGRWLRVSGDSQSEADQLPDINGYCDDRDYLKGKVYEVHGKSAYKGAQDPYWQKVVEDIKRGAIDVVVCWMVDRLDRQNILHAIPMVLSVLDAGGRIEFSEQPECNLDASDPNIDEKVKAFSDRVHAANQESKIKSKRLIKKQRSLRAAGSAIGRAPWGYEIVCRDFPDCNGVRCGHIKVFVPTPEGRKWVNGIFNEIIGGMSLRNVAEWMEIEGVTELRSERTIERMIKNPIYYGARRNSGQLETEALVGFSVWQQAGEALKSRAKPGRSTVVREKALLAPVCANPDCDASGAHPSPMYRQTNPKKGLAYYRCNGRGPRAKGCGNMWRSEALETRVINAMLHDTRPHIEYEFVAADDRSDEIGKLREAAAEATRKGDYDAAMAKMSEAKELEAKPTKRARWDPVETGQTEGEFFSSLATDDARRDYLKRHCIIKVGDKAGDEVEVLRAAWVA